MNLWVLDCFHVKSALLNSTPFLSLPKQLESLYTQTSHHFFLIPSARYRLLEIELECYIWYKKSGHPEMCVFWPTDVGRQKTSTFGETPHNVIFKSKVQAMFLSVLMRIFGEWQQHSEWATWSRAHCWPFCVCFFSD